MHATKEAETFSDLTSQQKKSGLAAWLGWLFDGWTCTFTRSWRCRSWRNYCPGRKAIQTFQ
jgi:hypothetical protein